jgi:hypothetical protein
VQLTGSVSPPCGGMTSGMEVPFSRAPRVADGAS